MDAAEEVFLSSVQQYVDDQVESTQPPTDEDVRFSIQAEPIAAQTESEAFRNWFGEWKTDQDLVSLLNPETNQINYEQLKNVADRIERGDQTLGRLAPTEERGRTAGGRRNVEASLLLAANERASGADQKAGRRNETWAQHKRKVAPQEDLLEQYARDEGIWFDFDSIGQENVFIGEGMESDVYKDSANPESVLKVVGYDFARSSTTPQDFLDRIALHNYLFPGTKYELVGFTKDEDYFKFVVRQPFIEGEVVPEPQVQAHMKEAYEAELTESGGGYRYANANYLIDDLHGENVIKTPEGNLAFIDPIVNLNYADEGRGGVRERAYSDRTASKVVNEDGTPKVVYHGTGASATLTEFNPSFTGQGNDQIGSGFYFTNDPDEASAYTTQRIQQDIPKMGGEDSPGVLPVYLAIKNPIRVDGSNLNDSGIELTHDQVVSILKRSPDIYDIDKSPVGNFVDIWSEGEVADWMIEEVAETYEGEANLISLENDFFGDSAIGFRQALHDVLGYDGVVQTFKNGKQHWVAWFPSQVKSATGNRGTFDPENPDIRFRGGEGGGEVTDPKTRSIGNHLREKVSGWAKRDKVHIVTDPQQLPGLYRKLLPVEDQRVTGLYVPARAPGRGDVYILAYNLRSVREADITLAHEAIGHMGVRGLIDQLSDGKKDFQERFNRLMDQVYDSYATDQKMKDIVRRYGLNTGQEAGRRVAGEEFIAHVAESYPNATITQRVISFVRDVLRKLGLSNTITDADIAVLLSDARRFVEGSGQTSFNEAGQFGSGFRAKIDPAVTDQFNSDLQDYIDGSIRPETILQLGQPGEILRASGLIETDIVLKQRVIKDKVQKHGIPAQAIMSLPDAINNPIMVYDWGERAKAHNILTELEHQGNKMIVSIGFERKGQRVEVNEISSFYPKDVERFLNEIKPDRFATQDLEYVQKEKALEWIGTAPSLGERRTSSQRLEALEWLKQPPSVGERLDSTQELEAPDQTRSAPSLREQQSNAEAVRNIIQNFENPNIDGDVRFSIPPDSDAQTTLPPSSESAENRSEIVRQDTNTSIADYGEHLQVPGAAGRISRLTGTFIEPLHWLEQKPAMKSLADKVRDHYDNWARWRGFMLGRMHRDVLAPLKELSRAERKRALGDFEQYMRLRETGQKQAAETKLADSHPLTQKMAETTTWIAQYAGRINQSLGVQVFDPTTGEWRKIGNIKDFFPRKLNTKTEATLRNPSRNKEHWDALVDALIEEGHVETRQEADRYLNLYNERYIEDNYFAGMEKARTMALPSIAYDYRFEVIADYMNKWSERVSQIESFGQVTTPDTKDAFDQMKGGVADQATREISIPLRFD